MLPCNDPDVGLISCRLANLQHVQVAAIQGSAQQIELHPITVLQGRQYRQGASEHDTRDAPEVTTYVWP